MTDLAAGDEVERIAVCPIHGRVLIELERLDEPPGHGVTTGSWATAGAGSVSARGLLVPHRDDRHGLVDHGSRNVPRVDYGDPNRYLCRDHHGDVVGPEPPVVDAPTDPYDEPKLLSE